MNTIGPAVWGAAVLGPRLGFMNEGNACYAIAIGEQHSHWAPAIRTDCDGPSTPASIRRGAMRLHLTHLRERGRPGTGLPVRGSWGFRPPRAAFLSLSGQSVAGTGEPPGTARTSDLSILSP
eukprot:tig00021537_g22293.t1